MISISHNCNNEGDSMKVIWYYVEQRINEIMKEENRKENEAVEQKRKELIDMFNNI